MLVKRTLLFPSHWAKFLLIKKKNGGRHYGVYSVIFVSLQEFTHSFSAFRLTNQPVLPRSQWRSVLMGSTCCRCPRQSSPVAWRTLRSSWWKQRWLRLFVWGYIGLVMPATWVSLRSNSWVWQHLVTPPLQQSITPFCLLRTRSPKQGNHDASCMQCVSIFGCWCELLHLPVQHWLAASSPPLPDPRQWLGSHDGQCCSTHCQPAADLRRTAHVTLLWHALTQHWGCAGQDRLAIHTHWTQTHRHSAEKLCCVWHRPCQWVTHSWVTTETWLYVLKKHKKPPLKIATFITMRDY